MKRTKAESHRLAKKAFELRKEGYTPNKISGLLGVSRHYVNKMVRKIESGYYNQPPKKLVKMVAEEVNESAYITVMLFDGDPGENLLLSIPKPKSEDVDEYMLEVQKSVLKRLKWCYAHEGFRFITGV